MIKHLQKILQRTPFRALVPAPTPLQPPVPPIRGVNLGGWLVLEKWITPSLFQGTTAVDEYTFCASKAAAAKLQAHRDSYITKNDFVWLKQQGIDAVRLPVGYWVFGEAVPYSGAIEYVDKAFDWAQQTGLSVLLDLHAAPGSQNGAQESGRIGEIGWHANSQNIKDSLAVIARLAERYGSHPSLLGIELLNEPHSSIKASTLVPYYEAAYQLIRRSCGESVWVVFSDGFKPRRYRRRLQQPVYTNICIDTHQYQTYTARDQRLDVAGHLKKTMGKVRRQLVGMSRYHPVITGEWSLVLNPRSLQGLNQHQLEVAHRAYGAAQLITYERSAAWFYWTYKTENGGVRSFRDCREKGWLPAFK